MRDLALGVPLTFAIALALSASSAEALQAESQASLLVPGSLHGLFNNIPASAVDTEKGGNLPQSRSRLSQWFNGGWFSCYYGGWRRC